MNDLKKFESIVQKLLKKHNIKIIRRSVNSGAAYVPERKVIIPKITNIHQFLICIHEIGHIINNWSYNKMSKHRCEFLTEKWTLQQARKYKLDKHYPTELEMYSKIAKRYVVNCCHNNHKKIPSYVMNWIKAKPSIHAEL